MAYKYSYDDLKENPVETLTIEIIKKDLNKNVVKKIMDLIIHILLTVLLYICGTTPQIGSPVREGFQIYNILFFISIITAIAVIVKTIKLIKLLSAIKSDKIVVYIDKIVNLEADDYPLVNLDYPYFSLHNYFLYFEKTGRYLIPSNNYKWSDIFSSDNKGVYKNSRKGDNCYVVLAGSKKISLVYNTQFFKFIGQATDITQS